MKPSEIITERIHSNVLCCDIQPAYDTWCGKITPLVCDFLNKQSGEIVMLYNGQDQTSDDALEVLDYLREHGFDSTKQNFRLYKKEYGFFRNWMSKVDDHTIISAIREMILHRVDNSRKLEYKLSTADYKPAISLDRLNQNGLIWLPDFMTVSQLRFISPFYLIGGASNRCLREIELICNAFNIRHRRIANLIYD